LRFVPSTMQTTCQYLYPDWTGLPGLRPRPVQLPASPATRPGFPLAPPGLLASLPRAIRLPPAPIFFSVKLLLTERGVPLDYTTDDAEKDLQTLESVLGR
jgi:hypothetical protein